MSRPLILDASFWHDPRLAHRSPRARLLWLALLHHADDRGRVDVSFGDLALLVLPSHADGQMTGALRKDLQGFVVDGMLRWQTRRNKARCLKITGWDAVFTRAHRASSLPTAVRYAPPGQSITDAEVGPYKTHEADHSLAGAMGRLRAHHNKP